MSSDNIDTGLIGPNLSTQFERFVVSVGIGGWASGGENPRAGENFEFSIHLIDKPITHQRIVEMALEAGILLSAPDRKHIPLLIDVELEQISPKDSTTFTRLTEGPQTVTDFGTWNFNVVAEKKGVLHVDFKLVCQEQTLFSCKETFQIDPRPTTAPKLVR